MKILVFSDTHGDSYAIQRALISQPKAEVVIHCGDGADEFQKMKLLFPDKAFYMVKGNNDLGYRLPPTLDLVFEGKRVFVTHGHFFNVKWGLQNLIMAANDRKADIVLFGHTHMTEESYHDGLYVFNPGACYGRRASYGILEITQQGILTNIITFR